MIQLDEKAYLYLLGLIPVLLLIYLVYQWWRKKAQRKFADSNLLRRLAPDRSFFKPQLKMILFMLALALLTLVLTLAGCASSPPASDQSASEPAPVQEIEPWDGDGMEIPLDGSSMEAWDRSMARVEAHTDDATFTTLQNAIDYLLTYDLSARKDMNRLIKNLDGLTGYEVVGKVRWRLPAPGKGPAEKGATDVKLIDT